MLPLLVFTPVSAKLLNAQKISLNAPSDTQVVLWSGVDPEVAERLRAYWNEEKIAEIPGVIALFEFLN